MNDGGPAFPFPSGPEPRMGEFHERCEGMALRDYLAAHAPEEPAEWFELVFPEPYPETRKGAKLCANCYADIGTCLGDADCEEIRAVAAQRHAWHLRRKKAVRIQWRWAWADAMLAERNKEAQ